MGLLSCNLDPQGYGCNTVKFKTTTPHCSVPLVALVNLVQYVGVLEENTRCCRKWEVRCYFLSDQVLSFSKGFEESCSRFVQKTVVGNETRTSKATAYHQADSLGWLCSLIVPCMVASDFRAVSR